MASHSGKVAIVTGASRGIGRAIAHALARADASLVLTAATAVVELEHTVSEIGADTAPERVLAVNADVTDPDACADCVARAEARFGRVDILVNNAGKGARFVGEDPVPFWEADVAGWGLVIDTNVNGPFYMARAAAPGMIRRGWGRIVNISKSVDTMHERHGSPYGASKAALDAMTLSWAQDLLDTGVTVNALAPGGQTDTRFGSEKGRVAARAAGRLLQPDVVVPAALWLTSDESTSYTGCRFIGGRWNESLPVAQAAEAAREAAAFRPPTRGSLLTKPWEGATGRA